MAHDPESASRLASRHPEPPGGDDGRLTLRDALIAWGDPTVLSRVRDLEWLLIGILGRRNGLLTLRTEDDRKPSLESFVDAEPLMPEAALRAAWMALLADFKAKVGGGELSVSGVAVDPVPNPVRGDLPASAAPRLELDLEKNRIYLKIEAVNWTYAAVRVRKTRQPPAGVAASGGVGRPGAVAASRARAAPRPALPAGPQRRGGRRNASPLIEQIVHANWEFIEAHVARSGAPVWTYLATHLLQRARRTLPPDAVRKLPQGSTLRQRLPKIYAMVLTEKAASEPSGQ